MTDDSESIHATQGLEGLRNYYRERLYGHRKIWNFDDPSNIDHDWIKMSEEDKIAAIRDNKPAKGIEEATQKISSYHYSALETYCQLYLKMTGALIEDLVLCEQQCWEKKRIYMKYWLEPKSVNERRNDGLVDLDFKGDSD